MYSNLLFRQDPTTPSFSAKDAEIIAKKLKIDFSKVRFDLNQFTMRSSQFWRNRIKIVHKSV